MQAFGWQPLSKGSASVHVAPVHSCSQGALFHYNPLPLTPVKHWLQRLGLGQRLWLRLGERDGRRGLGVRSVETVEARGRG